MRALASASAPLAFAERRQAAGDKTAYDSAKASAKSTYEARARRSAMPSNGNAKDICVAEAKAVRTRTDGRGRGRLQEHAEGARARRSSEVAEADYKVAKERCDDKTGNDKDVCVKVAKAGADQGQGRCQGDPQSSTDAKMDASKDKREADYKVAAEKCDAMSGDAKGACVKAAKANYGMCRRRQPRARRRSRKSSRSWPQNISPSAT